MSDDPTGVIRAIFFRVVGARLAADFFATVFLPVDYSARDSRSAPRAEPSTRRPIQTQAS